MAHLRNRYMDSVFELVVHDELEIWTSLPHTFMKRALLQLPGQYSLCSLCVSRDNE